MERSAPNLSMNVSLTPELRRLVEEKVRTGLHQTASEVVREAFRLLKDRDENAAVLKKQKRESNS